MLENRPLLKFDFTYWEGVSALFGTSRLDYLILFWNESESEVISWLDLAEVTLKQKIKTRPNFNVKAFSGDNNIDVSQLMSGIELSKYCNVNSHGNSTQVQAKPDNIFR